MKYKIFIDTKSVMSLDLPNDNIFGIIKCVNVFLFEIYNIKVKNDIRFSIKRDECVYFTEDGKKISILKKL